MRTNLEKINIAYIDATNLDKALKNQLYWNMDYKKFRVWLFEKYNVKKLTSLSD